MAGDVDAVVAAPQHETSIAHAGIPFDGHPSFVARQTGQALRLGPQRGAHLVQRDVGEPGHLVELVGEDVADGLDVGERTVDGVAARHQAERDFGLGRPPAVPAKEPT